jgi:hypothetical protein
VRLPSSTELNGSFSPSLYTVVFFRFDRQGLHVAYISVFSS